MSTRQFRLKNPPIIETVIDIDCDLPPDADFSELEAAMTPALAAGYPHKNSRLFQEHQFTQEKDAPPAVKVRQGVEAFQYFSEDRKQLVQIRRNGFSFNRLAPYEGLDVYLPEIEWAWNLFAEFAEPKLIRKIGLRTINRIFVPIHENRLPLDEYFVNPPRLPDVEGLIFAGFAHQYRLVESTTSNQAMVVLTAGNPEADKLPVILDINVFQVRNLSSLEWTVIAERLSSIRSLKNNLFRKTVTEKCLSQY